MGGGAELKVKDDIRTREKHLPVSEARMAPIILKLLQALKGKHCFASSASQQRGP